MLANTTSILTNRGNVRPRETGILRKKETKEEELFVFGYSCKIFEDYEKAQYMDQGKHLIPWNGDENLKIDRYDGRGALNDLTPYMAKSEMYDRWMGMTKDERKLEQLCDEERYRALTANEDEEKLYQEEEIKRLKQAIKGSNTYSEVSYKYDEKSNAVEESKNEDNASSDSDEPFVPSPHLDLPVGMKIPETRKHHEIIERTALFINDHGPQMEILLKIKQTNNPQFNFLSFDNELHVYYRHLLNTIKTGRYRIMERTEKKDNGENDDNYLHPTLGQTLVGLPEPDPVIPNINYKPDSDCAYLALVNRIKESQIIAAQASSSPAVITESATPTENRVENGVQASRVKSNTDHLPLSALSKSARRRRIRKEKEKAVASSYKVYYVDEEIPKEEPVENTNTRIENTNTRTTSPILKAVPAPVAVVEIPPPNVQLIIDKMASYVSKNGPDFEDVVKSRGDERFNFLESNHKYNPYYRQKVNLYLQLENPKALSVVSNLPPLQSINQYYSDTDEYTSDEDDDTEPDTNNIATNTKKQTKKKLAPISFSIKKSSKSHQDSSGDVKNALLDESDGEEGSGGEFKENTSEEKNENIVGYPVMTEEYTNEQESKALLHMALVPPIDEVSLKSKMMNDTKEMEKERILQAERRRRAAEFINLLQKDNLVNSTDAGACDFESTEDGPKKDKTEESPDVAILDYYNPNIEVIELQSSSDDSDSTRKIESKRINTSRSKSDKQDKKSHHHKKKRKRERERDEDARYRNDHYHERKHDYKKRSKYDRHSKEERRERHKRSSRRHKDDSSRTRSRSRSRSRSRDRTKRSKSHRSHSVMSINDD